MNREQVLNFAREALSVEADCPFAPPSDALVLRHPASGKWFAILLETPCRYLGLPGDGKRDLLNLRCGPELVGALMGQPGFAPAYHMSKRSWIGILLDNPQTDADIRALLELAYEGVRPKARKGVRRDG